MITNERSKTADRIEVKIKTQGSPNNGMKKTGIKLSGIMISWTISA
jgi:hypothetical protein